MAKPPLQAAQDKWKQREAILSAGGIPSSKYQQLMAKDLQNVQQGGAAMSGAEVKDAIFSAAGGQSVIGNPQPSSGIESILSNIPKDVGSAITGFIPGMARFAWHLPSEIRDTGRLAEYFGGDQSKLPYLQKKYGIEDINKYGTSSVSNLPRILASIRDAAKTPLFGLVPGYTDVADLTSKQGRANLIQHPVFAGLDILPFAKGAGEIAAASKLGSEGALLGDVGDPTTVASALSEGHLGRAALRAGADVASPLLDKLPGVVGDSLARLTSRAELTKLLTNMGLHPDIAEMVMRPHAIIRREAERKLFNFVDREIKPMFKGMAPEDLAHLHWVAEHRLTGGRYTAEDGTVKQMDSHTVAITRKVGHLNELWAQKGVDQGVIFPVPVTDASGTHHEYYSVDQPIVDSWKKYERATAAETRAEESLAAQADKTKTIEDKLLSKLDKLHRYGEDQAVYDAREPELVTVDKIRENLVHPLLNFLVHSDSFQHLINEWLKSDDTMKSQAATRVIHDMVQLTGKTGLIARLDQALQDRNFREAGKITTQIKRIFTTHKSWANFTDTTRMAEFMVNLRNDLVGIEGKDRASRYVNMRLTKEYANLTDMIKNRQDVRAATTAAAEDYRSKLLTSVPARFHPQIVEAARTGLTQRANELYHGSQLDTAIQTINNSTVLSEMKSLFPEGEYDAVMHDAMAQWMKLVEMGHDPLWVHSLQPQEYSRLMHPQVLADHFNDPGMFETKVMNFTPHVMDLAAGLTAAAQQIVEQDAAKAMIEHLMDGPGMGRLAVRKFSELQQEYLDSVNSIKLDPRFKPFHTAHADLLREWKPFDPARYGVKGFTSGSSDEWMIPAGVAKSLDSMMRGFRPGSSGLARMPIWGAYDKTMKVFKYSVLTGPRHLVHVAVGGMLGMMVEDPRSILQLAEAFRTVKNGKVPFEIPSELFDVSTDKLLHIGIGKSFAEHFVQAVGDRAQALRKFEEHVATSYRLASYMAKIERGIDPEVALDMIHKYFVDLDGMTAPERVILKNVFPFYAFTKYLFRYLLNFPVDHPVRAAILAQFAQQEQKDWKNGLPQSYQQLFFFGHQNSKGDILAIDFKNINPFRSFANDLTLTGFFSQLNPIVTAPFELAGLNVLNGTGQLYPQVVYDPVSGSLKAKRPGDTIPTILANFIPETGAIDHFFTITQQMKQLKRYSPQAYRSTLFSQLNLPFAWGKINVPYVQEKQEIDRYKAASTAVSQLESGQSDSLGGYQNVPYNGKIVSSAALLAYWKHLLEQLAAQGAPTGESPKAVIRKPRAPRSF